MNQILQIHNWRRFENIKFQIPDQSGIIVDQNGTGKTSLLTAIYSFHTGRAWPTMHFKNCLRSSADYFGLSLSSEQYLSGKTTSNRIQIKFIHNQKEKANFITYQPTENLWLTLSRTSKLEILDLTISGIHTELEKHKNILDKAVKTKSNLIKNYAESGNLDQILWDWANGIIIAESKQIWRIRSQFLEDLQSQLHDFFSLTQTPLQNWQIVWETSNQAGNKQEIKMGNSRLENLESSNLDQFEDNPKLNSSQIFDNPQQQESSSNLHLKNLLNQEFDLSTLQTRELAAQKVLFGAHRDDFRIVCGGLELQNCLSRGEMRLFVLFVKSMACKPDTIWLLDDVFNELDNQREITLIEKILCKGKLWLATGTVFELTGYNKWTLEELVVE